jgi:uncharacterized membrane protein
MLVYAVYFGKVSLGRFDAFQAPGFDLGIFDQGIWLLSRFKEPFVTIMGLNLFGDHASYILLGLVPLYWIWPAPELLLILQTLALCLGAVPVFLMSRRAFRSSWLALLPALAYLLSPALGWLNLENFHPDSFEVPLVLFALYFMTERRWRLYLVMVVLALSVKEDVALLVVPLGIYVALRHDRRIGYMTAEIAAIWFVVTVFLLGPFFSGTGAGRLDAFRIPFGGFVGLVSAALRTPWEVLAYVLQADKLKYLTQLLTPVFFLPLLTTGSLIALPVLLFNLLSTFSYQTNLKYHYTSLIIPVLAWAAVLYIGKVKDARSRRALAVAVLLSSLFAAYAWGPTQWSRDPGRVYQAQNAEARAAAEAVAMIPDDAVVSARSRLATHLTHRAQIYDFPTPFSASYWGDASQEGERLPAADDVQFVLEIPERLSGKAADIFPRLAEEGFRVVFARDGVVLLQRISGAEPTSTESTMVVSGRSITIGP